MLINELDYKKSLVLEYLREQVTRNEKDEETFTFEVSQKEFEESRLRPQYGQSEVRDIVKQISSGTELGVILDYLTEETNGEFKLQSLKPAKKKDSPEPTHIPEADEMVENMISSAATQLGIPTGDQSPSVKHIWSQPNTQWCSEYNVWIMEYHPENANKPRSHVSRKEAFTFYLNVDRELIQTLPERLEKVIKLSQKQYNLLVILLENDHNYTPAKVIAGKMGSPVKYVQNLAQVIKKEIDKKFLGVTGSEFIESDDGYRLGRKINLIHR